MIEVKLDAKDVKLLQNYCENATMPLKLLAKKIGLSREATAYRIKRLTKEGLITRIAAKIDASRFYPNAYCLFLRFSKLNDAIRNMAVDVLVKNENTMWVTTAGGEFDLITSFLTQNSEQLARIIKQLESALGKNLKDYAVLTYEKEYKNRFSDLFDEQGTIEHTPHIIRAYQPAGTLDDADLTLLYALSLNANLTNKQLSEMTSLTPEAVRIRIKNLEKQNLIHGYRAMLDICKLKRETYYLLIKFDGLSAENEQKLQTYILQNKHIYYSAKNRRRLQLHRKHVCTQQRRTTTIPRRFSQHFFRLPLRNPRTNPLQRTQTHIFPASMPAARSRQKSGKTYDPMTSF